MAEREIEAMAKIIAPPNCHENAWCLFIDEATRLHAAGYRLASEVREEAAQELDVAARSYRIKQKIFAEMGALAAAEKADDCAACYEDAALALRKATP